MMALYAGGGPHSPNRRVKQQQISAPTDFDLEHYEIEVQQEQEKQEQEEQEFEEREDYGEDIQNHNQSSYFQALCPAMIVGKELEDFMVYCSDNLCCTPTTVGMQGNGGFWSGSKNSPYDTPDDVVVSAPTGAIAVTPVDDYNECHQNFLVDPFTLFQEEFRALADMGSGGEGCMDYDLVSCDSSISSTGSMLTGGQNHIRVRVCFDASLAATAEAEAAGHANVDEGTPPSPSPPPRIPLSSIRTGDQSKHQNNNKAPDKHPEDAKSQVTEKSARFNEALNTTIEFIPADASVTMQNCDINKYNYDYDDDEDEDEIDVVCAHCETKSEGGKVNVWSLKKTRYRMDHFDDGDETDDKDFFSVLDEHRFDYRVLGTSMKDASTQPHVLTTSIMDALQDYLPYTKRGELFWLKYSMVRDGASIQTMLHKTRMSNYTILAIETLDGEVFGAFTGEPWRISWAYYGSSESFLWRLRRKRTANLDTRAADEKLSESDLEVFKFAGQNRNIQLCKSDRFALGGGDPDDDGAGSAVLHRDNDELTEIKMTEWGFGLAFEDDLQRGSSSPCITFESPALSKIHSDGSRFEVANIEIWTLTPCTTLSDAERMEAGKMTLERCMTV